MNAQIEIHRKQIVALLALYEKGVKVADIYRENGVSLPTFINGSGSNEDCLLLTSNAKRIWSKSLVNSKELRPISL